MTTADQALRYAAELAWSVFPLHTPTSSACSCGKPGCASAGKHPRTLNGLQDATSSVEQVGEWLDRMPDTNIGIATGAASGIIVIDVDGPAGDAALAALCPMPATPTSLTSSGRHLVFRRDDFACRNSAKRLGPDLDVRGDGGYIVAPPSLHRSGHVYRWADGLSPWDVEPAQMPEPLHDRLQELEQQRLAPEPAPAVWRLPAPPVTDERKQLRAYRYLAKIGTHGEGSRNHAAFQAAAFLTRDLALPMATARAYLAEWNALNLPPLSTPELDDALRNGQKYGRRTPGAALRGVA